MGNLTIFMRKDVRSKDRCFPLYASVFKNGQRIRFSINVSVPADAWDSQLQIVKGNSQEVADTNLIIANARAKITEVLVKARLSNENLTGPELIARYRRLDSGDDEDQGENFFSFARAYLNQISGSLSFNTIRVRLGILKKIENYEPTLKLKRITPEWLRQYVAYCKAEKQNGPGTIKKNLDTIHQFISVALREGRIKSDPFDYYKVQGHQPKIVFLTEEELKKLVKLHASGKLPEYQERILDLFLFMAFTGMHYSDACNLSIDDISDGEIHYHRMKTGILADVPITLPALRLIDKYKEGREHGKLFENTPTNEHFNRAIKDICSMVKIRKQVSAKTARHSFATLFYKKTKDIGTLSKLLGHTSVRCTMIYAHIMKEDRTQGMAFFDEMV